MQFPERVFYESSSSMFLLNVITVAGKHLFLVVFQLLTQLRSKSLTYLRRKHQHNRLQIVVAQVCSAITAPQVSTSEWR